VSCSDFLTSLESKEDGEANIWIFCWIIGHQGPLTQNDKNYNGSNYNIIMIKWENDEITGVGPLSIIAKDDHVKCTIYTRDNNFKRIVNQVKLHSYHTPPRCSTRSQEILHMKRTSTQGMATSCGRMPLHLNSPSFMSTRPSRMHYTKRLIDMDGVTDKANDVSSVQY
jgi:hypothetical protein